MKTEPTELAVDSFAANNGISKPYRMCHWLAELLQCRCLAGTQNVMLLAGLAILVMTLMAAISVMSDSKMYLGSWLILLALSMSWCHDGPFDRFVVSALWGLSSEDAEAAAREAAVKTKLRLWNETAFCVTLLELLAVTGWIILRWLLSQCCRRWAYSVETMRKLAYMCFSTFVCLSQFTLLVALPMSTFLGSELSKPHEAEPCANAMMLLSGQTNATLEHPEATLMSCGFTAVSYIGLNLVFFFLALPPGIFMGIMMFFTVMWSERRTSYMADLAALCLLVTELVSFASILGPFVITYQILGGSMEWWLACGVVGVFRPLFAVPACLLMNRFAEPRRPVFLIASVSLAYLGLSFTGAVIFWKSFNVALEALSDAAQRTTWGGVT